MDLARWLVQQGLERPSAALWATLGVCSVLVLLGVALVAWQELKEARSHCRVSRATPRGATRHTPTQPREGVAVRSGTEQRNEVA